MKIIRQLSILCSLFMCSLVPAMEINTPFSRLDPNLIGAVALQLVATIGTPEVINETDIPVIIKNVKRLSRINKHYRNAITSDAMTGVLINAIVQRFVVPSIQVAVKFNSKAGHQWIENNLRASGAYALYKEHGRNEEGMKKLLKNIYYPIRNDLLEQARTIFRLMTTLEKMIDNEQANQHSFAAKLHNESLPIKEKQWYPMVSQQKPEPMEIEESPINSCQTHWPHLSIRCTLCKKTYCSKKCQIKDWQCHKEEAHPNLNEYNEYDTIMSKLQLVRDVKGIPAWGTYCAEQLTKRPIFNGNAWQFIGSLRNMQTLSLADFTDAEVITEMNHHTQKLLGSKSWFINKFGATLNDSLTDKNGNVVKPGIYLSAKPDQCSFEELQQAYEMVINTIRNGWEKVALRDYPEIMWMKSEEEWDLLIKSKSFSNEWRLLCYLGVKFGFTNKILASNMWASRRSTSHEVDDLTYLWIKKKYVDAFQEIFQLQIAEKQQPSLADLYQLNHIDDIPSFLATVAQAVDKQPEILAKYFRNDAPNLSGTIKPLSLTLSVRDKKRCGYLCHYMTEAANKLNKQVVPLYMLSEYDTEWYTNDNERICDDVYTYLLPNRTFCQISELPATYKEVITMVQQGWKYASLAEFAEYPKIKHTENEQEWHLLVKNTTIAHEVKLLYAIAAVLGLSECMSCHDEWIVDDKGGYERRDVIYLWVKKNAWEKFQKVFELQVI